MTFFNRFPMMIYDVKNNDNYKLLPDILRRVKLRSAIRGSSMLFDTYDVRNGERPEDIAFKWFGNAELHWVILMTNNVTDRYYDWPLTDPQFQLFLTDKYGAGSEDAVHHYEIEQTSGDTSIKIDIGTDNTNYSSATAITNFDYEQKLQDEKRKIRLLDPQFASQFVEEFENLMGEEII